MHGRTALPRTLLVMGGAAAATLSAPVAQGQDASRSANIYVDCGINGERASGGAGSQADPIRDLATLNQAPLSPGSRILFRRGSLCRGTFKPAEGRSGLPGAPIRIDAYGTKTLRRPVIAAGCVGAAAAATRLPAHRPPHAVRRGATPDLAPGRASVSTYPSLCAPGAAEPAVAPAAIYLRNAQHWEIRDVEVTNDGLSAAPRQGIIIELQDFGEGTHYLIDNVSVHHVRGLLKNAAKGADFAPAKQSGGIQFRVVRPEAARGGLRTRFTDVTVQNSDIWAVDLIGLSIWSEWMCRPTSSPCRDYRPYNPNYVNHVPWSADAGGDWFPSQRIVFRNNRLHDIGGDAIIVRVTDGALVEANLVTEAWTRAPGNSAGIWAINADNTLFQFNEVRSTRHRPAIEPGDGMAFDADMGTYGTIFRHNYSAGNAGGLALLCGCGGNESRKRAVASGTVIDGNFSFNDGRRGISLSGSEKTVASGNIFVSTGANATPLLESVSGSGVNEIELSGNRFITGSTATPLLRAKNKRGPVDGIRWSDNRFQGRWSETASLEGAGNRFDPASPTGAQIDALYTQWARRTGFEKRRFDASRIDP